MNQQVESKLGSEETITLIEQEYCHQIPNRYQVYRPPLERIAAESIEIQASTARDEDRLGFAKFIKETF
jgi:hypothetical protein